jgi:hypothetical protein
MSMQQYLSRMFFEIFPWCILAQLLSNLATPQRHGPPRLAVVWQHFVKFLLTHAHPNGRQMMLVL